MMERLGITSNCMTLYDTQSHRSELTWWSLFCRCIQVCLRIKQVSSSDERWNNSVCAAIEPLEMEEYSKGKEEAEEVRGSDRNHSRSSRAPDPESDIGTMNEEGMLFRAPPW